MEQNLKNEEVQSKRSLTHTSFILMIIILIYRVLGFARELVIAHFFGATAETDVFYFTYFIPNIIVKIFVVGVAVSVIIPDLVSIQNTKDQEAYTRYKQSVLGVGLSVASIVTVLLLTTEKFWMKRIGIGFSVEQLELATKLLWIMMPLVIFYTCYTVLKAILNSEHVFILPELGGLLSNIFTITWPLLFYKSGIQVVAYGFLIGGFFQCLLVAWRSKVKWNMSLLKLDWILLSNITRLAMPIMTAEVLFNGIEMMAKIFASDMAPGSITAFEYAYRIMYLPLVVITGAIITVTFPKMAMLAQSGRNEELSLFMKKQFQIIQLLIVPIVMVMFFQSENIIRLLFGHGSFTEDNITMTAGALKALSFSVFGLSMYMVYSKAFYAVQARKTVAILVGVALVFNIVIYMTVLQLYGLTGLAASFSFAYVILGFSLKFTFDKYHLKLLSLKELLKFVIGTIVSFTVYGYLNKAIGLNNQGMHIVLKLILNSIICFLVYYIIHMRQVVICLKAFKMTNERNNTL